MAMTTESLANDVTALYQAMDLFGNDTGSGSNSTISNYTGPSEKDYSSYTLREVTVFLSTYYLWVILVIGVPGNLASIFTILSMPTVSSSKVKKFSLLYSRTKAYHDRRLSASHHSPNHNSPPLQSQQQTHPADAQHEHCDDNNCCLPSKRYKNRKLESEGCHCRCFSSSSSRNKEYSRIPRNRTAPSLSAHVAILAAADICAITLKIAYSEVSKEGFQLTTPGCALIMFLQQFFTTYVNWIVVAMTTERFVAVWFPLRVGRIYTRKKAWCILAIFAYLTAFCYACFFWIFREQRHPVYGYYCFPREKFHDFINGTFWYWFEGIINSILPCTLVVVGNILIITNIRRAKRAHRHLTNSYDHGGRKAKDQRQITIMLIVVSVVFLVLNLPNTVFYVVKRHWNPVVYSYEFAQRDFMFRFVHILMDTNHAVNFFLYFLSMSTFRRRFIDVIMCRSTKRRPTGSMYRTSQTYMASSQHEISRSDIHGRNINNIHPMRSNCVASSESHHSLKSCYSGNNHRISTTPTDSASRVTANSDV